MSCIKLHGSINKIRNVSKLRKENLRNLYLHVFGSHTQIHPRQKNRSDGWDVA